VSVYLRFRDLVARGILRNRVTLASWVKNHGFPPGTLIGPNTRAWSECEIEAWLAARPTAPKPTTLTRNRRPRPRKRHATNDQKKRQT
jgi:predicted DNA-binding transcriptional regulator AlpA